MFEKFRITAASDASVELQCYKVSKGGDAEIGADIGLSVVLIHGLHSSFLNEYGRVLVPREGDVGGDFVIEKEGPSCWASQISGTFPSGVAVYGLDLQGHGESESWKGRRSSINEYEDFAVDIFGLMSEIGKRTNPKCKFYVVGISMGGCIATDLLRHLFEHSERIRDGTELSKTNKSKAASYLQSYYPNVVGAALLAPALSLKIPRSHLMNRILEPFAALFSMIAPSARLVAVDLIHPLYPQLNEKKTTTYQTIENVTVSLAAKSMKTCDDLQGKFKDIGCHVEGFRLLCCHAENDGIIAHEGSENLIKLSRAENKLMVTIPESSKMYHFLTNEPATNKEIMPHIISEIRAII